MNVNVPVVRKTEVEEWLDMVMDAEARIGKAAQAVECMIERIRGPIPVGLTGGTDRPPPCGSRGQMRERIDVLLGVCSRLENALSELDELNFV